MCVRANACHGSSCVALSESDTRSRSKSTSRTSTVTSSPTSTTSRQSSAYSSPPSSPSATTPSSSPSATLPPSSPSATLPPPTPPSQLASMSSIEPSISFIESLRLSSLRDYLTNVRSYRKEAAASFITRISGILLIIFHHLYARELEPLIDSIPSFLLLLLHRPFQPLSAFINAKKAAVAPSTMLARLDDLSTFVTWFCYHDLVRPELAASTKDCIKGMRRNFNKQNKAQQSGRTLQSEVALRHLPEATNVVEQVAKLQQPVQDRMEWARRFRSSTPPHVTKEVFGEFMGLLYSSLYLFSPQGRISGIHCVLVLEQLTHS